MKTLTTIILALYTTAALAVPLPPKRPADLGVTAKTWPPGYKSKPYTGQWLPPKEIQNKVAPKVN